MRWFRKDRLSEELARVNSWLTEDKIKVKSIPSEEDVAVTVRTTRNGKYNYIVLLAGRVIGKTL